MPKVKDPLHLLRLPTDAEWPVEETKRLTEELSLAYHMDEVACTSREVERISEKVRARMNHADVIVHGI
jgi:hypothetical protein